MGSTHEKTRRERATEIKRQAVAQERRRRNMIVGGTVISVVVLIGLAIVGVQIASNNSNDISANDVSAVSGAGAAVAPPWPVPADAQERAKAAGMPMGAMGTAEHYHVHLDITVDGKQIAVPSDVGVDMGSGTMSALHTHSGDGVVHIESDRKGRKFTLGQLFTEWNVRLTVSQIGSLASGNGKTLTAFIDGKKSDGNPAMIQLAGHQQISLVYGDADAPVDVRDSYDFGAE